MFPLSPSVNTSSVISPNYYQGPASHSVIKSEIVSWPGICQHSAGDLGFIESSCQYPWLQRCRSWGGFRDAAWPTLPQREGGREPGREGERREEGGGRLVPQAAQPYTPRASQPSGEVGAQHYPCIRLPHGSKCTLSNHSHSQLPRGLI